MWRNKLKRKKKQMVLIGFMLFVISMVLSACMIFFTELNTYVGKRFSEKYCPDVYVYSIGNINYNDNFPNEEVQQNIENICTIEGKNITVPLKHKDQKISSVTNMFCLKSRNGFDQYITPSKGDVFTKDEPGDDEVWISSTLAESYDIEVGDTLSILYEKPLDLSVTGIFISTCSPSERLTIMPSFVNKSTLNQISDVQQAGVMAVNLKEDSTEKVTQLSVENPNFSMTVHKSVLMQYVTKIQNVVGIVSAVAAFIVFLASLFIIRYILNVDIGKELTSIGIYKSLGYKDNFIIRLYMTGYLMIGVISILLGIFASFPVGLFLCKSTTRVLGMFSLSGTSLMVCSCCFVILLFILMCSLYLTLKQIKRITPVELLVSGKQGGDKKISRSVIKHAKSEFTTAVNSIFKHKKTSVLTFLVLTLSIYLILFFGSSLYSCSKIYENANRWVFCPKFDAVSNTSQAEELTNYLRDHNLVKSVQCGDCFYFPPINFPEYDDNSRNIDFFILEDTDDKNSKLTIDNGTYPIESDELALAEPLLSAFHKKVGDDLLLTYGGREIKYHICGSFASMEPLTVFISIDGIRKIYPEYKPNLCFIQLNESNDVDALNSAIKDKFKEIYIDQDWSALQNAMASIEKMLTKVMSVLLIIFCVFTIVAIVNILALDIHNKKKQYGIMLSLGFRQEYIIRQNIWYITIMMFVSYVLAILLNLFASKYIFKMIVIDALVNSGMVDVGLLLGITLIIYVIVYSISKSTSDVKPLFLMES